jgi:hypothetical protein
MAYSVSEQFRNQLYSGESTFRAILTIGENTIDNDQIASISISSPIIDDSKQVFYVGSFISQKITIKFKNMDGIEVKSGDAVDLKIGQYVYTEIEDEETGEIEVQGDWYDVPIGKYLVDDLAENYYEKCEITCLDYGIKFKPNIDYSPCFVNGKATVATILQYICDYFNVSLGDYPTINDDVEVGTYDSTVSGKQWISYIAELKGCNAKIDRSGNLVLQPIKQGSNVPINALESASWELGEKYEITQVTYFDAIRNFSYGTDEGNTLIIRQDNPFITDTSVVQNIYDTICVDKYSASGKSFDLEDVDAHPMQVKKIYGETSQNTLSGKNLYNATKSSTTNAGITYSCDTQYIYVNNTNSSGTKYEFGSTTLPAGTYRLTLELISGSASRLQTYIYKTGTWTTIQLGSAGWINVQNDSKKASASFTLSEETQISVGSYMNGNVFSNAKVAYQITSGTSSDYNFEPYCGGIPSPNPSYPQNVNVVSGDNDIVVSDGTETTTYNIDLPEGMELCKIGTYQDYITKNTGKNLFDISKWYNFNNDHSWTGNGTYYISASGEIISNTAIKNDYYSFMLHMSTTPTNEQKETVKLLAIPVKPNTHYTFSFNNPSRCNMQVLRFNYDADCKYISHATTTMSKDIKRIINITTLENQSYLFFRFDNESYSETPVRLIISNLQVEEGDTATDYEPYGKDKWYLHKEIGKKVFNGSETWTLQATRTNTIRVCNEDGSLNNMRRKGYDYDTYSNYFKAQNVYGNDLEGYFIHYPNGDNVARIYIGINKTTASSANDFKTWLSTHNTIVNYVLETPTNTEITYTPLIDQLNTLQNAGLFKGINHITIDTLNEVPTVDIDYYKNSHFNLWSLKTHNYGDFTLDAWDLIEYSLGEDTYTTLNNNTITYEMSIMSDVNVKIPNKTQEVTTNIVGGDESVNIKKIKTEVDQIGATATILAEKTQNNTTQIAQLQVSYEAIQNLFTLQGGINIVRNSAFLLGDAVWGFVDNGNNPYHTPLGASYNVAMAGITSSVSEIKLQDVIVRSIADNITGLKTDGTIYTLNFSYKQDTDTITTIRMYDVNDNTNKAFDDIVITGAKDFQNYVVSFRPHSTNYIFEIETQTSVNNGAFYLYDLMLNIGEKQSWSPAPDEIYSTTLTMSRLGLKVYSIGDGTITLLGSDGLITYETTDGVTLGRIVSLRTADGDKTRQTTTQSNILTSDIMDEHAQKWHDTIVNMRGRLHKITYLETGE